MNLSRLKKPNQECHLPIWTRLATRLAQRIWSTQLNRQSKLQQSWLARNGQDAAPNAPREKNLPFARRTSSQSAVTLIKNTTQKVCAPIVTSSLAGKSAPPAARTNLNTPKESVKIATWRSTRRASANRTRRPRRQQLKVQPLIKHHLSSKSKSVSVALSAWIAKRLHRLILNAMLPFWPGTHLRWAQSHSDSQKLTGRVQRHPYTYYKGMLVTQAPVSPGDYQVHHISTIVR